MKLNIFPFENFVNFEESTVNTLQIENKKMFIKVVETIYNKYYNLEESERLSLIKNGKEIDFEKNVILVSDICRFELNERKILNTLYTRMEELIKDSIEDYVEIKNLYDSLTRKIDLLLEEFEIETLYNNEPIFQDLLKMIGLKIYPGDNFSFTEKTFKILDLNRELLGNKLIIFINSKAYFTNEELEEIIKYGNYNKDYILFLESIGGDKILGETSYIIDNDYCEFIERT